MGKRGRPRKPLVLTDLHLQILDRIANGDTNGEIAQRRGMSLHQVLDRCKEIYRILGARNRAHAAALAVQACLVGVDEPDDAEVPA